MDNIIVALIGAVGLVTATLITAIVSLRITTAKDKAAGNTDKAESLADTLWVTIDRLRMESSRLAAERDMLQRELDALRKDRK